MEKLTYTVAEMATVLGISKPTAYDLTERQDFPVLFVGRKKLIPIAAFETWVQKTAWARTGDIGAQ